MSTPGQTIKLIDYRQKNASNAFVPKPAVLSSSGWDSIYLELHQQPKFDVAEHQHTMHVIAQGVSGLQCRIDKAKYLLQHSELSIADIAARVGFCDQSHFNRYFKRIVGITPKQLLQNRNNLLKSRNFFLES
jgi:hypothetical protein